MSTMTKNELRNLYTNQIHVDKIRTDNEIMPQIHFKQQLTVLALVKTMLEIINVKGSSSMDDETRKQFPMITKEIIFLAEHIQ